MRPDGHEPVVPAGAVVPSTSSAEEDRADVLAGLSAELRSQLGRQTPVRGRQIGAVLAAYPHGLLGLFTGETLPRRLIGEIDGQLAVRTVEQLAERVRRRYVARGYAVDLAQGAVSSALGLALALVRAPDCADVECEDGVRLGGKGACEYCTLPTQGARRAARTKARQDQTYAVAFGGAPADPSAAGDRLQAVAAGLHDAAAAAGDLEALRAEMARLDGLEAEGWAPAGQQGSRWRDAHSSCSSQMGPCAHGAASCRSCPLCRRDLPDNEGRRCGCSGGAR